MSLLTRNGVYLVTNVAYPEHYLVSDPQPATSVSATSNTLECWRLQQNPETSLWTMRAIVSEYEHHLNYVGEGSSYLAVGDEAEKSTTVVADKTWVTLQAIQSEED